MRGNRSNQRSAGVTRMDEIGLGNEQQLALRLIPVRVPSPYDLLYLVPVFEEQSCQLFARSADCRPFEQQRLGGDAALDQQIAIVALKAQESGTEIKVWNRARKFERHGTTLGIE